MQTIMSRIKEMVFLIALVVSLPSLSCADQTTKSVLDNGMTVVVTEMPASPLVSVYGLVKTGSATEGKYLGSGMSHFLEHMVFKGNETYAAGEIPAKIKAVGGYINASTSMDYTIYTITVPSDKFDTALEVLSELLMNAVIDPEEVEKERDVIHGEMRLYNDNPDRLINRLAFANIYLRHPYRHPIIGYPDLLDKLDRDDIRDYYKSRYAPNNIVLSVAGNIKADKALEKVKEQFKGFKRGSEILRNLPVEPEQISARRYEQEYPTDAARLVIAFSSVSLLNADLYPLDVLAEILGQGRSSRLYSSIYDKKRLVYSISAYNYTPADRGVFEVNSLLKPANVDEVISSTLEEIETVKKKGVSSKELKKAARQVLSAHIFSQQTSSSVAHSQAYDEAFTGDYAFSRKYVDAIRNVTEKDIVRVAKKYLQKNRMTVVVLKPEDGKEDQAPAEASKAGVIAKFSLQNGLTVLIREDHSSPTVSMRLVLKGGLLEEAEPVNGITNLTKTLWNKGTRSYSASELAELNDSLSLGIAPFSGKNSLGISLNFLSEDIEIAMDVLEDMVKHPVFDEKEMAKAKQNIKAGIKRRKDNISGYTGLVLRKHLFANHPYGMAESGEEETVDQISRDDILEYYRKLSVPSNMVLAVYGDVKPGDILDQIKAHFGKMDAQGYERRDNTVKAISRQIKVEENLDKEQAMVMVGFQGVDIAHKDRYGLEVLASILGSSFSGRLFTKVREELGQAYTLGGVSVPGIGTGYVYFYVLTSPENVDSVKAVLMDEIKRIAEHKVGEKELADIQSYLTGRKKADLETNFSLAFLTSLDELYGLGFEHYKNYDDQINRVTAKDILRLAQEYLDIDKSVTVVTRPKAVQR